MAKKTILADNLFLFSTRTEDPVTIKYEVECTSLQTVEFTLNFEGSENFNIFTSDGSGGDTLNASNNLKIVVAVRPFTRTYIGKVSMANEDKRASLRMGCAWVFKEADERQVREYMAVHTVKMMKYIRDNVALQFPSQLEDPDNVSVREIAKIHGKSFIDREFPPLESSLYRPSEVSAVESSSQVTIKRPAIEWKRPIEFMKGKIETFHDGISADDIRQGALGDCWFLCALAALTEFPVLVQELFPAESKKYNEQGVYNVKFCKGGIWQEVRVDDYFPCYPGGGPIYSRANGEELWVLLAEKAYAKIHGSYEAIRSGWAYEAMMDLTGSPCFSARFDDADVKAKIATGEFWTQLMGYDMENYIMSASTPGEDVMTETGKRNKSSDTGLVAGHAYTLIAAKTSSKGHQLVKLRNPWGAMEWKGDWSDTSSLWTQEMQDEIEPLVKADDGTFWMSFQDLLKHFYSINVCMVRHPSINKKPWKSASRSFFLDYSPVEEENADAPHLDRIDLDAEFRIISPVFILTVQQKSQVVAMIHQEDTRIQGSKPYIDIGISILKTDPVYGTYQLISGTGSSTDRQTQTNEVELQPGKYVIVPYTSGSKLKQFLRQQLSEKPEKAGQRVALTKLGADGKLVFSDAVTRAYSDLFHRIDVDADGYLNKSELDTYMLRTEGATTQEAAYQWLVNNFAPDSTNKGLSLAAFLAAQLFVFQNTGNDEEKLYREFKMLGYDDQLELLACRRANISVHSLEEFQLETIPYDEQAVIAAQELVVQQKGEIKSYADGKIKLYKHKGGYNGVSLMVENLHHLPLVFQLDCSDSENCVSHYPTLLRKETVPPKERVIFHHLMPASAEVRSWSWAYTASYYFEE